MPTPCRFVHKVGTKVTAFLECPHKHSRHVPATDADWKNGFAAYRTSHPATLSSGIVPMPTEGQNPLGGHAVIAFGADMTRQLLYLRNSWGSIYTTAIGDTSHANFALPFSYFDNPHTFLSARAYYL